MVKLHINNGTKAGEMDENRPKSEERLVEHVPDFPVFPGPIFQREFGRDLYRKSLKFPGLGILANPGKKR